jgi:hypothetical protein
MTEIEQKKEPFIQRNAWIVFIIVAVIFLLFGVGDVIRGMDADPAIAESIAGQSWEEAQRSSPKLANLIDLMVRGQGSTIAILAILSIAVTYYAFRPGERWAWYALWILPVWNAAIFLAFITAERQAGFAPPPPMLSAPVFFSITALALVLSYRRFFPRE